MLLFFNSGAIVKQIFWSGAFRGHCFFELEKSIVGGYCSVDCLGFFVFHFFVRAGTLEGYSFMGSLQKKGSTELGAHRTSRIYIYIYTYMLKNRKMHKQ